MSEQWERIQKLFREAIDLPEKERAVFLDQACAGDAELRQDLASLLAHDEASGKFIINAVRETAQSLVESESIQPGTKIGDYEIRKLVGSGGMGEVYEAWDTRLNRKVAIKLLPSYLTNDQDRLRRFEQEARAAAALNHPNILAVFQMGTFQGAPYLVSELLEGTTLREQMRSGPLRPRTAIEFGVQIARGLAAAHEQAIVHRDLKPENLFVTKDGRVKILDFGLAKLRDGRNKSTNGPETEPGMIMGTAGYMSPEQVRVQPVDYRTDIFAFGAILFEMLSGRRAFHKATSADTMSAVLNEDPPSLSELAPATSPALQRVVRRCLEKNPEQRFQSASDLAFALDALSDSGSAVPSIEVQPAHRRSPVRLAGIVAITVAGLLTVAYWFRPQMPPPRISRIVQLTRNGGVFPQAPLFTDGLRVYYQAIGPLGATWEHRQVLANGEDDQPVSRSASRFQIRGLSPDGSEFVATSETTPFTVWRFPVGGGSPRRVADLVADDISWSHDGNWFAYSQGNQLFVARTDGTSPRPLTTLPQPSAVVDHIHWSPDDHLIRFTVNTYSPAKRELWEVGADERNLRRLHFNGTTNSFECCGDWTPDGRYFVFRSDREGIANLWALGEKVDWRRRPNRDPAQLTFGPVSYNQPVVSRDGQRIFAVGAQPAGELVRYDGSKNGFVPYLGGRSFSYLAYSRDRQQVAYVAYPEGTLWRARSDGTDALQLTFELQAALPQWSADDKRIAFQAVQSGLWKGFTISTDGGNPEPLPPEPLSQGCLGWIPGQNALTFSRGYGEDNPAIYRFDVNTGKTEKIPGTEGLYDPVWSPDGRYTSAVDASSDVLMLVDLNSGKRKQIAGPAQFPSWSPDSRYVYFVRLGVNWIFRVRVPDGLEEKFLEVPFQVSPWPFTVAPDGSLIVLREHGRYDVYSLSLLAP